MRKIVPCLWFDDRMEEAVALYASCFRRSSLGTVRRYSEAAAAVSGRAAGSAMTMAFSLEGMDLVALNGGPYFSFTPALSFFLRTDDGAYLDELWSALSPGGTALMDRGAYPFSPDFGWIQDRFGLSWQLSRGKAAAGTAELRPFLLFAGEVCGRAKEAADFYVSLFADAAVDRLSMEEAGGRNLVRLAEFRLEGLPFYAGDSDYPHGFGFSPALSFMVKCRDQEEIDRLWDAFLQGGEAEQCGWLRDRFGVSWQIVPENLDALLYGPDEKKAAAAERALYGMKKLDIAALEGAV